MSVSEFAGPRALEQVRQIAASDGGVSVLIAGEAGAGQETLARALAGAYLCLEPVEGRACETCIACAACGRTTNIDLLVIEPSGRQDLIQKFRIVPSPPDRKEPPPQNAREFMNHRPAVSRKKVVVIHRAERMNVDAANALLKMLEEPPEWGRFVLTTTAASRLLPTVRSRCVLVPCDFPDVPGGALSILAGGAPELLTRISQPEVAEALQPFIDWLNELPKRRRVEALKASEEFQELAAAFRKVLKTSEEDERTLRGEFITLFANRLSHDLRSGAPFAARALPFVLEMHRCNLGNVHFGYMCDSLFAGALR